jgi:hypothetical protein
MRLLCILTAVHAARFGVHPDAQGLPDLLVDADVLRSSVRVATIRNDDPCLLVEGCLLAAHPNGRPFNDQLETRKLVRFSTRVWNTGTADVHLGLPPMPEGAGPAPESQHVDEWWEYSGCHNHYHLSGYAVHRLLAPVSHEQIEEVGGTKTGFCARDNVCVGTKSPHFTCDDQGISAGCADHYGSELACQWVDVTDVDPYRTVTLEITVNEGHLLAESNYSNNQASVTFRVADLSEFHDPYQAGPIVGGIVVGVLVLTLVCWWVWAVRRDRRADR